jgi:3-dehydrosphinganine reductase
MQKARQNQEQILKAYSCSLNDATNARTALETVCQAHGGRNPDAVFLCAGGSRPGFFIDQDEASMRQAMDDGYWVQAWSALVSPSLWLNELSSWTYGLSIAGGF